MIVGILAIRLTGRGKERFELLGLEFLVGYQFDHITLHNTILNILYYSKQLELLTLSF